MGGFVVRAAGFPFFLAGLVQAAQAATPMPGLASPGYTGWGLTPSAAVAPWGRLQLGYDTVVPGGRPPEGHNLMLSAGLLPGMELTGRLATRRWQCNLYAGPDTCQGPRDLSAGLKFGTGGRLGGTEGIDWALAAGANDIGGAATYYRSLYGVGSLSRGDWTATLGLARGKSALAPLDGAVASLAWRPLDLLQLHLEHAGRYDGLGARLLLWPSAWRPAGVEPWLSWQHTLRGGDAVPRRWLGMGVSWQLPTPAGRPPRAATTPARPASDDATVAAAMTAVVAASGAPATSAPVPDGAGAPAVPTAAMATSATLPATDPAVWAQRVARRLAQLGFEDISVGLRPADGGVLVDAESSGHRWNDLDGLALLLGVASGQPDSVPGRLEVRLRHRGVVALRAVGDAACLWRWLQATDPAGCGNRGGAPEVLAGRHAAPPAESLRWWVANERPSAGRPRLSFAPDIDSRVGTEYGSLDASVGIDLTLEVPLWRGASLDLAHVEPLGHSSDYDAGGPFADFRIDRMTYRAMLHQAVELAPGLVARGAAGRLFGQLDGGLVEMRWQPGDGQHRFGLQAARFSHREVDFKKRSAMGSYRYFVAPLDTALELHAGRFWHGDRGLLAVSRHWFGDVSIALLLRRSQFPPGSPALYSPYGAQWVNAAGIELTFPLTPRHEHVGQWLQLRGNDRFGYGVQTVVGNGATNHLSPWFGRFPPVPMGLADSIDNFDRNTQAYVEHHLGRLREAWRTLVSQEQR